MQYVLALDCGSTNFKAALFDDGLQRLSQAARPLPSLNYGAQCVELDAEETWQIASALLQQTCQQAGVTFSQVARLAITSQAQTFLLLDEQNQPLTPLISWLDRRADGLAAHLRAALGDEFARHCSFAEPMPQLQVAKLFWLHKNAPDLLARAACIASLPTWLALRLGAPAALDDNLAAMSGLYSLPAQAYWPAALALCGVSEAQLPSVVPVGSALPAGAPRLTLAGNDQTCGAYGNDCQLNAWVATLGTALVAYRRAGQSPGPYHPRGCWGPYPGGGYYELAVRDFGCAALDWARTLLFPLGPLEQFMTAAAQAAPGSAAPPLFYPDLTGSPTAWVGEGTAGERALAVLEGISFSLRGLLFDELGADQRLERLIVTGGGSRSDFWLQLLADILGVAVQRAAGDALLGAARLALPAVEPPHSAPPATWQPRAQQAGFYQALYHLWHAHL